MKAPLMFLFLCTLSPNSAGATESDLWTFHAGPSVHLLTDFGGYMSVHEGLHMSGHRTILSRKWKDWLRGGLSVGFSSGFLFEGMNTFEQPFDPSYPLMIPIQASGLGHLTFGKSEHTCLHLRLSGGMHVTSYADWQPYAQYSWGVELGLTWFFSSPFGISLNLGYAVVGNRDPWGGPRIGISFAWRPGR